MTQGSVFDQTGSLELTPDRLGSEQILRAPHTESPVRTVASWGSRIERRCMQWLLNHLGRPHVDIILWDGTELPGPGTPVGRIFFSDPAFLKQMILAPTLAFGDGYADGTIRIEGDLVAVLSEIYVSMQQAPPEGWLGWLMRIGAKASPHSVDHSRDNVEHHYDIGNDFYKLWLDERMLYTCAYYPNPDLSLEEAQIAKMDHVCRKLRLQPGETVIEAGCGWGALALHMAGKYGARVRAFNLSREQIAYAREQARKQGLADRVEFVQDDYRNVAGQHDAFVSVGMLEHVGPENFRELGRVIDRALSPAGRGLIHSIGRNAPRPMDAWIDRRIFPGAYPPALSEMAEIFEPFDFSVLDVENLRLHYAKTLAHWLQRYDLSEGEVLRMFDEKFVRTWRLYLAGSEAGFRCGVLQLFQVLFTRPQNNALPWSREHLYRNSPLTSS